MTLTLPPGPADSVPGLTPRGSGERASPWDRRPPPRAPRASSWATASGRCGSATVWRRDIKAPPLCLLPGPAQPTPAGELLGGRVVGWGWGWDISVQPPAAPSFLAHSPHGAVYTTRYRVNGAGAAPPPPALLRWAGAGAEGTWGRLGPLTAPHPEGGHLEEDMDPDIIGRRLPAMSISHG